MRTAAGKGDEAAALDLLLEEELPEGFAFRLERCSVPTLEWLQRRVEALLREKRVRTLEQEAKARET